MGRRPFSFKRKKRREDAVPDKSAFTRREREALFGEAEGREDRRKKKKTPRYAAKKKKKEVCARQKNTRKKSRRPFTTKRRTRGGQKITSKRKEKGERETPPPSPQGEALRLARTERRKNASTFGKGE